ncbi:FeoA family protein [Thermovibrio ammonificans]|uniref:FeoA family protein n=1 Tax=Thermovibrio ammonificans (strain DSM 15698 / JCM 12110 / HB-1) TaxID=648996 RepID=E8T464_THEA1|nr:FeoA domain-containing protein [Thermovibrio ammonificans]ADU97393.1 FeoA family protein [Thermovibrio ammonificans HB-1]
MKLLEAREGSTVEILNIEGGLGVRNRLAAIGIYPGARVRVIKSPPGPFIVEVAGSRVAIGKGMAAKVEVREVE